MIQPYTSHIGCHGIRQEGLRISVEIECSRWKKVLTAFIFGLFVCMESQYTLYKIFIPSLYRIQTCCGNDFTVVGADEALPSFETLISDNLRHRQHEEKVMNHKEQSAEDILGHGFFTHYCQHSAIIKSKIRDERLPRSFNEPCKNSWLKRQSIENITLSPLVAH